MPRSTPSMPPAGAMPSSPSTIPGTPSSTPGGGNMTSLAEMASGEMYGGFGFRWQGVLEVQQKLEEIEEKIEEARRQLAEKLSVEMEDWARAHAPWRDVSGAARRGLTGYAEHEDDVHISRAIIAHTVDYGLWLEVRAGGAYGIILPTILHFAAEAAAYLGTIEL